MTTLQVHLLMIGLGLLAFLLLAGVYTKRTAHRSGKPWISILAGLAVAASPFSRFWRDPFNGIDLVTQSLLISAISLLALLLLALLRSPFRAMSRARSRSRKNRNETQSVAEQTNRAVAEQTNRGGLAPIVIDAQSNANVVSANSMKPNDEAHAAATASPGNAKNTIVNTEAANQPSNAAEHANKTDSVTMDKQKRADADAPAQPMFNSATYHDPLRKPTDSAASEVTSSEVTSSELTSNEVTNNEVTVDKSREEQKTVKLDNSNTHAASKNTVEIKAAHLEKATKSEAPDMTAKASKAVNDTEHKAKTDQPNAVDQSLPDIESVLPKEANRIGTRQMDERFSGTNAANDKITADGVVNGVSATKQIIDETEQFDPLISPVNHSLLAEEELTTPTLPSDEDSLDLSETEQLFAELRSQRAELELPDDKELQDATQQAAMDELDLSSTLISADQSQELYIDSKTIDNRLDQIEEAEVVDADESNLEFGNDLTGEYAHPSVQSSRPMHFIDSTTAEKVELPETLSDALIVAKVSAVSVHAQVSSLENSIGELDSIRKEHDNSASKNLKDQQDALIQKESLICYEEDARLAAESVIAAQNAVIDRAKRQTVLADKLLQQERARMQLMQTEVERSRKMARSAAQLARKAAEAQQEIRDLAKREQSARLKSQESTRKAVTIARNAISALAAEERKRGITRH